jgi:hypothetical protein
MTTMHVDDTRERVKKILMGNCNCPEEKTDQFLELLDDSQVGRLLDAFSVRDVDQTKALQSFCEEQFPEKFGVVV